MEPARGGCPKEESTNAGQPLEYWGLGARIEISQFKNVEALECICIFFFAYSSCVVTLPGGIGRTDPGVVPSGVS